MFDFEEIKSSAEWKRATPAARAAVEREYAADFWLGLSTSNEYLSMEKGEQERYQDLFDSNFESGRAVRNQLEGPDRSFGENMWDITKESFTKVGESTRLAGDMATGDFDDNAAGLLAGGIKRRGENYIPEELQATHGTLQEIGDRYDQAEGFWDTTKAVGAGIVDTGKELISNPKGVAYLTAESIGNSAPGIGGQLAGAATGAALAGGPLPLPHLKLAGGLAGAFMGGMTAEMAPKFEEELLSELQARELQPTEENIQTLINDRGWVEGALTKARLKGAGTAGSDAIFNVGVGRIGTAPFRQAEKEVVARLGEGATREAVEAGIKDVMAGRSLGSRVGTGMKAYGAGIATEPGSEAVGQLAADGRIDLGELAGETLGGFGQSMISTPANIYAFGSQYRHDINSRPAPNTEEINRIAEDLPAAHTVDDVLAENEARIAADYETAQNTIMNAGQMTPNMSSDTVGGVLGEGGLPGTVPIMPSSPRLDFYLKSMADSLYARPGERLENPEWVKLSTLKKWEKETGEPVKSYVSSTAAKETLQAVMTGQPLNDKQVKVWNYLERVAERMAMVDEQGAMDEMHGGGAGIVPSAALQDQAVVSDVIEALPGTASVAQPVSPADNKLMQDRAKARAVTDSTINGYVGDLEQANNQGFTDDLVNDMADSAQIAQVQDGVKTRARTFREKMNSFRAKREVIVNPESVALNQEVDAAPTEAQAEAGNYKKAHVALDGLNITIENPAGTTRSGTDKDGKAWSIEMKADYGYVRGSKGYDKDHVDVVMAPGYQGGAQDAYIVNQHNKDGKFDEHKVVLGVASEAEAMEVYNSNYESGWDGGKSVAKMPVQEFREWIKSDAPQRGAVTGQAVDSQEIATKPVEVNEAVNSEAQAPELVEHVTKGGKGRTLRGIIRRDLTKEEATAIDQGTFKKDGGFFIREKYLAEAATSSVTNKSADVADQEGNQAVTGDISGDKSATPKDEPRTVEVAGMTARIMPRGHSTMIQAFVPKKDGSVLVKNGEPLTAAGETNDKAIEALRVKIERATPSKTETVADTTPVIERLRKDATNVFLGPLSNEERVHERAAIDTGIVSAVKAGVSEEDIYKALYANGQTSKNLADLHATRPDADPAPTASPSSPTSQANIPSAPGTVAAEVADSTKGDQIKADVREERTTESEAKEPWQMTAKEWAEEWAEERGNIKPNVAQSNFTKASGSQAVSQIKALERLLYGVGDSDKQLVSNLQDGAKTITEKERLALIERLESPVSHQRVVEKAMAEGKPVPAEVLADYPELAKTTPELAMESAQKPMSEMTAADHMRAAADKMDAAMGQQTDDKATPSSPAVVKDSLTADKAGKANLEDFGEKIGGARKDTWNSLKDSLSNVSDSEVREQPLSKSWPLPNYEKLLSEGVDKETVSIIRALRDSIPSKPRKYAKSWADSVVTMRTLASDILAGELSPGDVAGKFKGVGLQLRAIADQYELYNLVGHGKSLAGLRVTMGEYTLHNGVEYKTPKIIWTVNKAAAATAMSNWPKEFSSASTRQEAVDNFVKGYSKYDVADEKKKSSFVVWSHRAGDNKNKFFVGKEIGRNQLDLAGPFDTAAEARSYRLDNEKELEAKLAKYKEIPRERRDTNNPRVGEDMRNGEDVTPEMFGESFGFRGVEFGNWVEQGRRQKDLNNAFDALMDMAAIIGVPPKALSLNGQLGLAFGARGSGGVHPAAAHYERGKIVINLTKKEGAGSLGHEWWHALDNYFSRSRSKPGDMMSEALDVSLAGRGSDFTGNTAVRREMVAAFGAILGAIKKTAMAARSSKLDDKRTKAYWTTQPEMAARAFESYLISKLQDQNASNDYLSNIVDEQTWKAAESLGFELDSSYPYPTAGEVADIRAAFDHLFQIIKTKETDKGTALYSETTQSTGNTIANVVSELQSFLGRGYDNLVRRGKLEIVRTEAGLPENVRGFLKMVAWHGSPHNVDKFRSEKIGTGEGVAAYGHGLYFASSREVAEHYRHALSGSAKKVLNVSFSKDPELWVAGQIYSGINISDIKDGLGILEYNGNTDDLIGSGRKRLKAELNASGNLYQVELAPAETDYLLWDKPLSEQSEKVKAALSGAMGSAILKDGTGQNLYNHLSGNMSLGSGEAASVYLHSLGIRGIKYLDGTSRGVLFQLEWADGRNDGHDVKRDAESAMLVANEDMPLAVKMLREKGKAKAADALESNSLVQRGADFNYVIFDENDIQITAIYSKNGTIAGAYDQSTGKTYLVSDAIKSGEAAQVFIHEAGHALLREDKTFMAARSKILSDFGKLARINPAVKAAFAKVPKDTATGLKGEEALMYFLQDKANHQAPLYKRIIAAVKAALFRMGIPVGRLNAADLVALFTQGVKSWSKQKGTVKESLTVGETSPVLRSQIEAAKAIFSKLEEVSRLKFIGMKAQGVLNFLNKQGVKKAEIEAVGVNEWLAGKKPTDKVSRDELLNFVQANMVEVKDVVLSGTTEKAYYNDEDGWQPNDPDYENTEGSTYFEKYTEPGAVEGSYREMFVTAPGNEEAAFDLQSKKLYEGLTAQEEAELDRLSSNVQEWQDGHNEYSSITNPVVRIRFNEVDVDGKRLLRIEEMQGPSPENQAKMPKHLKENIYQLGVKRILAYAKENGFDGVTLATKPGRSAGETQADRYSLENQVEEIFSEPKGEDKEVFIHYITDEAAILFVNKDGVIFKVGGIGADHLKGKKLDEAIGKEIATKIINSTEELELSGLVLKIGGEGLKTLYDQTLPSMLESYGKGKMVDGKMQVGGTTSKSDTVINGESVEDVAVYRPKSKTTISYLPLTTNTPASFPLFSVAENSSMSLSSLEETARAMAASKGSITFLKNSKVDSTFLDRVLSTPEYYFKKFAASGRVLQAALLRQDIRYEKETKVLGGFVEFVQKLRKTNKAAYTEANDYLVDTDQTGDGWRMKSKDDSQWTVVAPKWATEEGGSNIVGVFTDEAKAVTAMMAHEGQTLKEHGHSAEAIEAIRQARELTNRGFDIMAADMREIIAKAKESGNDNPFAGDGDKIDESGRYGVYAAGKKKPVALFATEQEANEALDRAAQMISYTVVSKKKGVKDFRSELKAKSWAKKHGGTVQGQKVFGNLTVKRRSSADMRPLTVKEALAQMGDLRGTFFPRIRDSGAYVLIAKKKGENSIRKNFDLPMAGDSMPTLQAVLGFATPIGREAKRLKMRGFNVTIEKDKTPSEDIFEGTNLVTAIDAVLQSSMETINPNDSEQVKAGQHINMILTMQAADLIKGRGYLSSRISRSGGDMVWEGYEIDMGKAITQYGKNVAAGSAKRETSAAMVMAFSGRDYSWNDYKNEVDKPDWTEYKEIVEKRRIDERLQKNLFRDVRSFMIDILRNDEQADRIMGTLKGLAVIKFLGFRISSATVNMTNMVLGVPATISGLTGDSITKALGRVTEAAVVYGKYRSGIGTVSAEDRAIFEYISAKGWDEAKFNHDALSELKGQLGDAWNKFGTASMYMFGAAEKANRAMTLFAAYKATGGDWDKAKDISDRSHGIYGKETIPAWARGKYNPLRLTYTFQKFQHNYMLNFIDLGFNRKEYKAAAFLLLSPALLAGAGATIAAPILFAMAGALGIGGDDPEEEFYAWAEETFGGGRFARMGAFGSMGINIKGSLSMNLPMPVDIGKAGLKDMLGAPAAVIGDTGQGLAHLFKGELAKGVEKLLPTAFGNASKALRESTEGVTTGNYGTIFYGSEPLKADTMDAFIRFLSFNPARLSGIREMQWNEKEVAARYQKEKSAIYSQIKRKRLGGEKSITPEILKTIKVYNDRVAGSGRRDIKPITAKGIRLMLKMSSRAGTFERSRIIEDDDE